MGRFGTEGDNRRGCGDVPEFFKVTIGIFMEIKYRGKIVGTEKWTYGVPIDTDGGRCLMITAATDESDGKIRFSFDEVDLQSVGQFTGLYDANGRGVVRG